MTATIITDVISATRSTRLDADARHSHRVAATANDNAIRNKIHGAIPDPRRRTEGSDVALAVRCEAPVAMNSTTSRR